MRHLTSAFRIGQTRLASDKTGSTKFSLRKLNSTCLVGTFCLFVFFNTGCLKSIEPTEKVEIFGKRGIGDGRFQKPRAIAIKDDELFVVDMTARIQVHNTKGEFVRSWRTPAWKSGKPCGLSFSQDGLLMVADTHYYRVLFYTSEGDLVEERTIGGETGRGPGEFCFVTDAIQDSQGNYYVAEYGDYDRIQKFDSEGNYLFEWGGHGSELGQFLRPQGITIDENDFLWVADACNHRIQVFDATGDSPEIVKVWGENGFNVGQLRYPYDLWLDGEDHLYIAEFGNNRIQKFTRDGESLGTWGGPGKEPGQLFQPWALCVDQRGFIHVLDTYNHRVQSFNWDEQVIILPATKLETSP